MVEKNEKPTLDSKTVDTQLMNESEKETLFNLTQEQVLEAKLMFDLLDGWNEGNLLTGHISLEEMVTAFRVLGLSPTRSEVHLLFIEADKNKNKTIEWNEFLLLYAKHLADYQLDGEDLRKAFKKFDRDNNGYITKKELMYLMVELGEEATDKDLWEMMDCADKNKDGRLDIEEFVQIMTLDRRVSLTHQPNQTGISVKS